MAPVRGNKRQGILEAAAHLIRTEGVHAASISEIIREAFRESLPAEWPRSMRVELVTGWAMEGVFKREQADMAAEHGISPATMTRRKQSAFCLLNGILARATAVIEVQHLDLIVLPSCRNAHRNS